MEDKRLREAAKRSDISIAAMVKATTSPTHLLDAVLRALCTAIKTPKKNREHAKYIFSSFQCHLDHREWVSLSVGSEKNSFSADDVISLEGR